MNNLNASTPYYFTVKAIDAAGNNSAASNTLTVTTNAAPDTQAPSSSTLTSTAKTSTSVSLSWSSAADNIGVMGYEVYNGTTKVNTIPVTGTTFTVSNLSPGTAYNFTVKAIDAAGNTSLASNTLSVTTNATPDTQAPTAPTLSTTGKTSSSVSLSWTVGSDNIGVTGYNIYNGSTKVNTSVVTGTTYTASNLRASTVYNFTVKAIDAAGNISPASNTLSATTSAAGDTQAPTAPTLSTTGKTSSTVTLSWSGATDNAGIIGYDVTMVQQRLIQV